MGVGAVNGGIESGVSMRPIGNVYNVNIGSSLKKKKSQDGLNKKDGDADSEWNRRMRRANTT